MTEQEVKGLCPCAHSAPGFLTAYAGPVSGGTRKVQGGRKAPKQR